MTGVIIINGRFDGSQFERYNESKANYDAVTEQVMCAKYGENWRETIAKENPDSYHDAMARHAASDAGGYDIPIGKLVV